jgi:hypothetical protein
MGPYVGEKWEKRDSHDFPPSNAKVKSTWSYTSTIQYVFMAWCLTKHMDFIFLPLCFFDVRSNIVIPPPPNEVSDYSHDFPFPLTLLLFAFTTFCLVGS